MKKKLIVFIIMLLSLTINVKALEVSKDDIPTQTYIIGNHEFTRNPIGNGSFESCSDNSCYRGVLYTKWLMLASSYFEDKNVKNMQVYYKKPTGEWTDATNGYVIDVPDTFDIDYVNTKEALSLNINMEDNTFTIPKGESTQVAVNLNSYIENGNSYKLYYEVLSGNSTFEITSITPFENGIVEGDMNLNTAFTLNFKNTGDDDITIKLGVEGGIKKTKIELEKGFELKINSNLNETLEEKINTSLTNNISNSCKSLFVKEDGKTYLSGNDSCINFNYVKYSDKLWRIVAINGDGTIKMITDNSVKEVDSSVFEANSDSDYFYDISKKNDSTYLGSNIYKYLNNEFLNTLSNYKNVIVSDSTWNDGNEADTNLDNIVKKLPTNTIINNSTVGKDTPVGLLNSYEYYLSYKNTMSASSTHSNTSSYLNNNSNWWLINGGYVSSEGGALFDLGMGTYSVRPVINLLKNIKPISGSGTKSNPYVVKVVEYHTVSFNTDGGSSISNQIIEDGKTITIPTNPTKEGYTFSKWQLNGEDFDTNTPITSDIELKAVWTINTYTVTFKDNDEVISTASVQYNGKVTKIDNPTKTGYTFSKWQLNGKDFDFNTQITSNIELNAFWTKNEYVVQIKNVDNYTVDCELIVTENGKEITVKEIKRKSDSESLGSGSHIYINKNEIASLDEFIVVLEDDTEVEAKKAS